MDNRAYAANASATPPTAPASPSVGYPKPGNPATNDPATKPGPYWYFQLGEEMRNVITGAGLTPDLNDNTQLRAAILSMIQSANSAVIIAGATFEASVANGEAVRWDGTNSRFDEAIADGTANNRAVGIADVTNGKVYCYGETPALFSGLTPGARQYLSSSTAGAVTGTAPADVVIIGIAKSATVMFVDIDFPAVEAPPSITAESFGLLIKNNATNPNYQLDIAIDEVIVKDASGNAKLLTAVSHTVDITVAGANGLDTGTEAISTWYYVWELAKDDGTKCAVLSASSTAPTMPAGYTFKARISAWYNNASGNFIGGAQTDLNFDYDTAQVVVNNGAAASETEVALSAVVPPYTVANRVYVNTYQVGSDVGGGVSQTLYIRHKQGSNFFENTLLSGGGGGASSVTNRAEIPLRQNSYWYQLSIAAGGSNTTTHKVLGFRLK